MTVRRWRSWSVLVVAGVLVVGACGGADQSSAKPSTSSSPTASPKEQVEALLSTVLEQPSFRLQVVSDAASDEPFTLDVAQHTEDGAEAALEAVLDEEETGVRLRVVDDRVYIDAGDDLWFSVALDDPDLDDLGLSLDDLSLTTSLEEIAGAALSFSAVEGRAEVDGVATRRFDVELDPSKVEAFEMFADTEGLDQPLTGRFLVDGDGLLRRYELVVGAGPLEARQEVTLSDFGGVEDVEAPPDHQPTTARELLDGQT